MTPNSRVLIDVERSRIENLPKTWHFSTEQCKGNFDDWISAFELAIRKRTTGCREKIFIGLSSGYDSGSIACELSNQRVPFKSYSILGNEDDAVITERAHRFPAESESELLTPSDDEIAAAKEHIETHIEHLHYDIRSTGTGYRENTRLQDDWGSLGVSIICGKAKAGGRLIYISGQGADEIISDYGFNGERFYPHSNFGGLFPDRLDLIFPWASVFGSTQQAYLMKEEYVAGSYGIEARYPFLDRLLVQEFLSLRAELKNWKYKSALRFYLDMNGYPCAFDRKIGFVPVSRGEDRSPPSSIGRTGDVLSISEKIVASVEALDTSAFVVESQTTDEDKVSLLRIQGLVRAYDQEYAYMEVGSLFGGTLAPHLADQRCRAVISIDPRVREPEDARGRVLLPYDDNSTSRMMEVLRQVLPERCLSKLSSFDLDAAQVRHADLPARADLLLIDGEHTTTAAFSDAMSLVPAMAPDAIVSFHDSNLVADAIRNFEQYLICAGIEFATVFLRDNVCAIGLRRMAERLTLGLGTYALDRAQFLSEARKQLSAYNVSEALLRGDVSYRSDFDDAQRRCTALQLELDEASRTAAAALVAADDRARACSAVMTQLCAIENSTSWRLTRPLRRFASRVLHRP